MMEVSLFCQVMIFDIRCPEEISVGLWDSHTSYKKGRGLGGKISHRNQLQGFFWSQKFSAAWFLWGKNLGKNLSKEIPTVMISIRLHSHKRNKANDKQTFHYSAIRGLEHSEILGGTFGGLGFTPGKKIQVLLSLKLLRDQWPQLRLCKNPPDSRNGGLGFTTSWISTRRLNRNPLITFGFFVSKKPINFGYIHQPELLTKHQKSSKINSRSKAPKIRCWCSAARDSTCAKYLRKEPRKCSKPPPLHCKLSIDELCHKEWRVMGPIKVQHPLFTRVFEIRHGIRWLKQTETYLYGLVWATSKLGTPPFWETPAAHSLSYLSSPKTKALRETRAGPWSNLCIKSFAQVSG